MIELEPRAVGLTTFQMHKGRMISVTDDVNNVVRDLNEIDPHLRVRVQDRYGYFVIYWKDDNGDESLVTTCWELDQRVVNRIRTIAQESYNYGAELDRIDKEHNDAIDYNMSQRVGDLAERLAHAFRKDKGIWKDSARTKASWGKGIAGH